MTTAILIGAPLFVIISTLYWVMSFGQQQAEFNAEYWKTFGVKV